MLRFLNGARRPLILCLVAAVALGALGAAFVPPKKGGRTLLACLWERHSTRRFAAETTGSLPAGALERILWCANGLNRDDGKRRTAPSAFECYPVTLFAVTKDRVFLFDPRKGLVERGVAIQKDETDGAEDHRHAVTGPTSGFGKAPVILVLVTDLTAFPERAGTEKREVWAHAECGAIGQNVYLACADLGLGTVFSAVMKPAPVKELLGLKEHQTPVYMMPIGRTP